MKMFLVFGFVALSSMANASDYTFACGDFRMCTQEYAPTECTYQGEIFARDTNKCHALNKLEGKLCAQTNSTVVKVKKESISCYRVF